MIILLDPHANLSETRATLQGLGLWTDIQQGDAGSVSLQVQPHSRKIDPALVRALPGVREVLLAAPLHATVAGLDQTPRPASSPAFVTWGPHPLSSARRIARGLRITAHRWAKK